MSADPPQHVACRFGLERGRGEDKDYGHIVDYKELFGKVQDAIAVYTADELDIEACGEGSNVEIKDWLKEGRAKLDAAREAIGYLCDKVLPPRSIEQFIHYFCGSAADPSALETTEPLRIEFYKVTSPRKAGPPKTRRTRRD